MKNIITIPNIPDTLSTTDELVIDMSNLGFDCDISKKKFYAFIFIRNTGIKAELDFEKCSYEDKEEYLLMFMKSDIEVKCPILASTWIEIISFDDSEIYLPSILNKDEIKKFIDNNGEFVNNLKQFINSLPIYAMYKFNKVSDIDISMDEFESTDNDEIKLANFYQLTEFDRFILLLDDNPSDNHKPILYTKMFDNPENEYNFMHIMERLPYFNLLNILFSDNESQNNAIKNINESLKGGNDNVNA